MSLEGHFLIAMPGIEGEPFERTVIYICAHSSSGAMGFIINKPQPTSFSQLLTQLGIVESEDDIRRPAYGGEVLVCRGGPVEQSRGFVLHSADYTSESTINVDPEIALTPTTDILRAMSQGAGPTTAIMALGYSGWAPGQLEDEIAQNGWLTCKADLSIVFSTALDDKYDKALALLGIHPAFLNAEAGHA
ncbi:YqgE/AlgH family protein [Fulvimarina sp. MAC3]|uniref:YqgE/AlgH family protein n=1 Tax=Fulvimarina sp. MAC3 TaxID=3148887 RepID=UPI0031FD72BD